MDGDVAGETEKGVVSGISGGESQRGGEGPLSGAFVVEVCVEGRVRRVVEESLDGGVGGEEEGDYEANDRENDDVEKVAEEGCGHCMVWVCKNGGEKD